MKTQSEVLTGWIAFCEINRLREILQPLTWCCDSRLRWIWQRDRDARPQGRVQRAV